MAHVVKGIFLILLGLFFIRLFLAGQANNLLGGLGVLVMLAGAGELFSSGSSK